MLLQECHIAYLNLDHRIDRLMLMATQLERLGIKADRKRGAKPEEYDLSLLKYQAMVKRRTPGAIGCYEGQISIMRDALALDRHAFVMEDDLVFCSDFKERIDYIETALWGKYWDIIWLGGTFHTNPPYWHRENNPELPGAHIGRDAELTDDPRIIRTYGAFCTYAYIVNKNSILGLLDDLQTYMSESMGIDWTMIKIQPEYHTFAFVPGCIKQRDNRSDIGDGDTIFSGFAKLGPYWYADKMEDFDPTTFNWHEAANK